LRYSGNPAFHSHSHRRHVPAIIGIAFTGWAVRYSRSGQGVVG
jgi:hypothetical protein